jgi:hypothetical protein
MTGRSKIVYLRLLSLFQVLWVLLAIQPAFAQVSLPPNFIGSAVPHDVPAGPSASIQDLAIFAWSEFIALNWVAMDPATTGVRGRPDVNANFLSIKSDSDGNFPLLVWHTYQHKNELFPASGQTAPSFDSKAPTYIYADPQPGQGMSFPLQTSQPTTGASFTLFNNLDETSEIGLANMYAHYTSTTDNKRIAYEAKVSRALFDYLNKNNFTNCPPADGFCPTLSAAQNKTEKDLAQYGGICSTDPTIVSLPCGDTTVAGDDGEGAIETKAAWRELTNEEIASGRFFTRTVIYYTGQSVNQRYNNAVYGLIALHIIHKTKSFPAFVFATWEQIDNYDDETNQNTQDLKYINLSTPPIPNDPVTRAHAIHSQIQPVNDAVHAAFTAADPTTIWQYYKLIGVQATPLSGPPVATAPPDDLSYYYLANIVVESNQTLQNFFGSVDGGGNTQPFKNVYLNGAPGSPFQMGGCQGCHGTQGQALGGDMSRIVALAPYDSMGPPESIDDGPATSIQSYLRRSNVQPQPLDEEQLNAPPSRPHGSHPRHGTPPVNKD